MLSPKISHTALNLPPKDPLALARLLTASATEPEPLTGAVKHGVNRIEDVATGKVAGLTEEQYRAAIR